MRLDDPPLSWRVDAGNGDSLRLGLFVRDAAGLQVSGTPDVPRLVGVPESRGSLGDRVVAGLQWHGWFQQLLELEFTDPATTTPGRNRAKYLIARLEAVCDPPRFDALADRPELQAAARAVLDGYRPWQRSLPERDPQLGWALLKQTAEDVTFDHRVSIDRVQARIVFLPVDGSWWTRVAPGCVLCSPAAAADPVVAQTLVRDAFVSGLTR